jgi:UDP-glucose 4-epimerase
LIYELFTIPLANARGSDSLPRGSDSLACLVSEPRALASGIVNKPQVKHAWRKDTENITDFLGMRPIIFLSHRRIIMSKTVAITGVNSYFASTILDRMQNDPSIAKIIGIDFKPWKGGYDKVVFYKADIRSAQISEILKDVDVVFHFAFIVGEIQNQDEAIDININGSRNVFNACVKNGIKKVIYTSSATVYGSNKDNPIGITEDHPLSINKDSYYNTSKINVERFVSKFFSKHPEIILTILRTSLLIGPNIDNMFSKLYSLPVLALAMGRTSYQHFIHEKDLGEALYLTYQKDLPGIYNVGADDAIPARQAFAKAGVNVIFLPPPVLKRVADIGFQLGILPARGGWASLSEYTIFINSDKFKKASGWQPRYTSEKAFLSFLESCKKDHPDNLIQSTLSWVFSSGARIKPTMIVLNLFRLGKIPGLRELIPWMNHDKNCMSYLPINKSLTASNQVLPSQVVHNFIDQSSIHVIMNKCGCRLAGNCQHYTADIGCLFMGETALKMPAAISRRVTPDEAHKHVDRAISVGLIPMTGKVRVDNFIFLTPDESKLLSVCFCCHCCCMMTALKHIPGDYLDGIMMPVEGLSIEVTEQCVGCGTCIETCGFNAISIVNGRAVHNDQCRGCGRCETHCPNQAIKISINQKDSVEKIARRIETYVDYKN